MSRQRYPEEFKIEAVKQVTEKGKPVAEVAQRLGMSVHSLYACIKKVTDLFSDGSAAEAYDWVISAKTPFCNPHQSQPHGRPLVHFQRKTRLLAGLRVTHF